jgi:hypothetical protein
MTSEYLAPITPILKAEEQTPFDLNTSCFSLDDSSFDIDTHSEGSFKLENSQDEIKFNNN